MKSPEYKNFDRTMQALIKVPHSEIKAKLDAEKAAKKRRNLRRQNNDAKRNYRFLGRSSLCRGSLFALQNEGDS